MLLVACGTNSNSTDAPDADQEVSIGENCEVETNEHGDMRYPQMMAQTRCVSRFLQWAPEYFPVFPEATTPNILQGYFEDGYGYMPNARAYVCSWLLYWLDATESDSSNADAVTAYVADNLPTFHTSMPELTDVVDTSVVRFNEQTARDVQLGNTQAVQQRVDASCSDMRWTVAPPDLIPMQFRNTVTPAAVFWGAHTI